MKPSSAKESRALRVATHYEQGGSVYSVGWWPGGGIFRNYLFFLVVFAIITGILTAMRLQMTAMLSPVAESGWLGSVLAFVVGGAFPLMFEAVFLLLLLAGPFFCIDHLSSKRVWLDATHLNIRKVFGKWVRTQRIPHDRIIDIKLGKNGSPGKYLYDVQVVYWLHLPAWLPDFFLNRVDRWSAILLNAIPTQTEAEAVQEQLLQHLTDPQADTQQKK